MRSEVLCLLLCALPLRAETERVVAFADVHGAYDELTTVLRKAGVVDGDLRWSAGATQVVSLGDLLDRGPRSRDTMDLLMRLQGEAAAAGGALHVVLGNHEAMNLTGDLRDTTLAEFASYLSDEAPSVFKQRDARHPPGWFGHRAAFSRDGRYGRWLLSLPVAAVVGDTLFMHGGPSRLLAGLSLPEINRRYHAALDEEVARPDRDPEAMLDVEGPNWYRGASLCNEASESDVLAPILAKLGVKRVVVGHTVTRDRRVASRFDGAVIKLDTGMNRAVFHGHPAALVIEGATVRAVYGDEDAPGSIKPEALHVEASMADEDVLARGRILLNGSTAEVALDGKRVPAAFSTERVNHELAAYRLDRALRLGLVPATVQREVDGKRGFLQARPARWATQADARRADGWCALPPQLALMRVFDALIGNENRPADRIFYDPEWMLFLTGHDRAFGTSERASARVGAEMRRRLAALDVGRTVGDLLTDAELVALEARRAALAR